MQSEPNIGKCSSLLRFLQSQYIQWCQLFHSKAKASPNLRINHTDKHRCPIRKKWAPNQVSIFNGLILWGHSYPEARTCKTLQTFLPHRRSLLRISCSFKGIAVLGLTNAQRQELTINKENHSKHIISREGLHPRC